MQKLYCFLLLCYFYSLVQLTDATNTQSCYCYTITPSYSFSAIINTMTTSSADSLGTIMSMEASSLDMSATATSLLASAPVLSTTASVHTASSVDSSSNVADIATSVADVTASTADISEIVTSSFVDGSSMTTSDAADSSITSSSNYVVDSSSIIASASTSDVSVSADESATASVTESTVVMDTGSSTSVFSAVESAAAAAASFASSESSTVIGIGSSSITDAAMTSIEASTVISSPSTTCVCSSVWVPWRQSSAASGAAAGTATGVSMGASRTPSPSSSVTQLNVTQLHSSQMQSHMPPQSSIVRPSTCLCGGGSASMVMTQTVAQNVSMTSNSSSSVVQSISNMSASIVQSVSNMSASIVQSGSNVSMEGMMYTCACPLPSRSSVIHGTHTVAPSRISPSAVSSHIRPSASVIIKPRVKIPSVFYRHYADLESGDEEFVSKIFDYVNLTSTEAIALTSVIMKGGGDLMASTADGYVSVGTPSISSAFVVNGTQKLKLVGNATFSGVSVVQFTVVEASSTQSVDLSGKIYTYYTLFVLIKAKKPSIKFAAMHFNKTINENSKCSWFDISDFLEVSEALTADLPKKVTGDKGNESMANIEAFLEKMNITKKRFVMSISVKKMERDLGLWSIRNAKGGKDKLTEKTVDLKPSSSLCFVPFDNVFGETELVLAAGLKDKEANTFLTKSDATIKMIIKNVNDKPILRQLRMNAPFNLPYVMTGVNPGFLVSQLITSKTAKDTDSAQIGLAIVGGQESNFGKFQYKCDGGWVDVNVSNTVPLGKGQPVNAIFLRPSDSLRFNLSSNDLFWKSREGKDKASLKVLAWDMSNDVDCGAKTLNASEATQNNYLSAFNGVADVIQLRLGCNNRPGSIPYVDACGVCMGDNRTCLGCDGKINSNATLDKCFVCSGGDTGVTPNADIDCAGTCDLHYNDSCGICQIKGFTSPKDCNHDCFGTARENECKVCVLGLTGKDINAGKDVCGVCNGKNDTCLDCANVPNGPNKTDLCGTCLQPSDPLFNTGCGTKLGKFVPVVISYGVQNDIIIEASSFSNVNGVTCKFNGISANTSSLNTNDGKSTVIARTPADLAAGTYPITCTFSGSSPSNESAVGSLNVIDSSGMSVTSISPSAILAGTNSTLTITGSGFVDSPELSCHYGSKKIPVTFISGTEVQCDLKKALTMRSMIVDVSLSFVANELKQGPSKLSLSHAVALNVPTMKSAKFNNKLSDVIINFGQPGKLKEGVSCADLFPYNYTSFGSSPKCIFRVTKLVIALIGSPSLGLGVLILNQTHIEARAKLTLYPGTDEQTVTIQAPPGLKPPKVGIRGTKNVGKCDPIKLRAYIPGGAAGKITYSWSVVLADGESALDAAGTSKLNDLNSTLATKSEPTVKLNVTVAPFLGKRITFTVVATNILDKEGIATLTVRRVDKTNPRVQLSRADIKTKVSRDIRIRAIAQKSSCLSSDISAKMFYQWQISPDNGIVIENMMSQLLVIPKQTLRGGKTYTVSVEVGMQEFQQYSVTEEAIITTESSEVVASVEGVQTIGSDEILTLSAKNSFDPDGSDDAKSFRWTVTNSDGSAVILASRKPLTLDSTEDITVNVQDSNLLPGNKYDFSLTYHVGTRNAMIKHTVKVVAGRPPKVSITTKPRTINPSSKILIEAMIKDPSGGTYAWSCEEVESTAQKDYGMIELNKENVITKVNGTFDAGKTNVALKFKPNLLFGGTYYRFSITATNKGGVSASAVYEFKTNSVPNQGILNVNPASGTALDTLFTISASDGWSDPDGDALTFSYFYSIGNGPRSVLAPQVDDSYWLQSGTINVIVRCQDEFGGFSEAVKVVVVAPPDLNSLDFTDLTDKATTFSDEGNLKNLISLTAMLFGSIGGSGIAELSDEQTDIQNAMLGSMTANPENLQTPEEKKELTSGMISATNIGGKNLSPSMKLDIIHAKYIVLGIVSNARRRRALTSNTVEEKTPSEVENDLKVFSNIITPDVYDDNTMKEKGDMLTALNTLTASMCKGFAVGEPSGAAIDPLVYLQTVNILLSGSARIELGCTGCGAMAYPDHVVLGSSIKDMNKCGDAGDSECTSACVSSWQMKYDLLSDSANSSIKSSVLAINLWDSNTQKKLDLVKIAAGMSVDIVGTKTNKSNTYVCTTWDANTKSWVTSGVETVNTQVVTIPNTNDTVDVVTCNVTKVAYIALIEGPPKPVTTNAPPPVNTTKEPATVNQTTSGNGGGEVTTTVQTTLAPENYPRIISFSFDYPKENCTAKLTADAVGFKNDIKRQVSTAAGVSESSITDFNVSCASIVVKFKLVTSGGISVIDLAKKIETAVSNMTITIDNKQVRANRDSFSSVVDPKYQKPVKVDDDLSTGAIVGIVIGVVAVLVIIIVVIYFCCIKKSTRKQNTVEPDDNALELKGRSNQAYTGYP